jgi:hypothetical protein
VGGAGCKVAPVPFLGRDDCSEIAQVHYRDDCIRKGSRWGEDRGATVYSMMGSKFKDGPEALAGVLRTVGPHREKELSSAG